jgi:hypothetical protein
VNSERPGPGLVKSKRVPLIERRVRDLVRCTDYRWRELFERADVVSEGAIRRDSDGPTYYGSTHVRLLVVDATRNETEQELVELRRIVRGDPHVRLRAIRLACLEAQIRSHSDLGAIRTEISFFDEPSAIGISVDVEAKLANTSDFERQQTLGTQKR